MDDIIQEAFDKKDFGDRLLRLQQRDQAAWTVFVGELRRVTMPWIIKRLGTLPSSALLSKQELALEIFADSLSKYYELFEKGHFTKPEEMQSLMFKVAELKMLETLRKLRKEALIYRPKTASEFQNALSDIPDWTDEDEQARERVSTLQQHLNHLKEEERSLLIRVYSGEKMSHIAQQMNATEEKLRKRKQRALERLKQMFGATAMAFLLFYQTWIQ